MSRRLSIVDLTSAHPSSDRRSSTSGSRDQQPTPDRAGSQVTPRGIKRRREDNGFWSPDSSESTQEGEQEEAIESIDLTEPETALSKALAKQREDAIKAQQSTEEEKGGGSVLSAYKCPVCMDTPEDATSTSCGHLFCHRCIVEYLNSADQRLDSSKQIRGTCPICRKGITKVDKSGPRRSLIPLQLKLTTKKRSLVPPSQA